MTASRAGLDKENGSPLSVTRNGLLGSPSLPSVREETVRLVAELSGGLSHVRVESGGHVIDVSWDDEAPPSAAEPKPVAETHGNYMVTAPLVGAFYPRPEPGAASYVSVGDTVHKGQQVGIVEAMKLMNPVTADRDGVVVAIHAEEGELVEYGQPLIELDEG